MAFVARSSAQHSGSTSLNAVDRREAFLDMASALVAGTVVVANPRAAEAKYSDYARREKDWDERMSKGEVNVSSAKDLRRQLAEIVPQNSEGSKIFCPNGASAAVSPLMENKCSDTLMALPSVYGRSNDATGNSIPGFSKGYAWGPGESTSISSAVGGFPKY
eukprot:CAMPEP_0201123852 /NCGR_PEP_ID=MMETSP0850-20130426/9130_1 /ASSEMBLY_ACC=CAM_ASM_000622 /TAXON_ID=183588 /ORGANISM="Pseudo-nitzschia fraudulenta, Strain WWA7" /LENGTH=161 /DNA_ID=CAMNT_0047390949 /DNA_START=239 /DNA_END=724 /DNA_ORIENTATION=+